MTSPNKSEVHPLHFVVDGVARTGKLDNDGVLNVKIKPNARKVTLTLGEDEPMDITLGSLDPVDTLSGIHGRLANLNFNPGPIDNSKASPAIEAAIKDFQRQLPVDITLVFVEHGRDPGSRATCRVLDDDCLTSLLTKSARFP